MPRGPQRKPSGNGPGGLARGEGLGVARIQGQRWALRRPSAKGKEDTAHPKVWKTRGNRGGQGQIQAVFASTRRKLPAPSSRSRLPWLARPMAERHCDHHSKESKGDCRPKLLVIKLQSNASCLCWGRRWLAPLLPSHRVKWVRGAGTGRSDAFSQEPQPVCERSLLASIAQLAHGPQASPGDGCPRACGSWWGRGGCWGSERVSDLLQVAQHGGLGGGDSEFR